MSKGNLVPACVLINQGEKCQKRAALCPKEAVPAPRDLVCGQSACLSCTTPWFKALLFFFFSIFVLLT